MSKKSKGKTSRSRKVLLFTSDQKLFEIRPVSEGLDIDAALAVLSQCIVKEVGCEHTA